LMAMDVKRNVYASVRKWFPEVIAAEWRRKARARQAVTPRADAVLVARVLCPVSLPLPSVTMILL